MSLFSPGVFCNEQCVSCRRREFVRSLQSIAPVSSFRVGGRVVRQARAFVADFPGDVLYAVKCNPDPAVLTALAAGGVRHFDAASVGEMRLFRRPSPWDRPSALAGLLRALVRARSSPCRGRTIGGGSRFSIEVSDRPLLDPFSHTCCFRSSPRPGRHRGERRWAARARCRSRSRGVPARP